MAVFPEYLNKPLQSGFSRVNAEGFATSDPASGPAFYVIETEDLPSRYNISFTFTKQEAESFQAWLRLNREVLFGDVFTMNVYNEQGYAPQEVRFVEGGTPQLTSVTALNHNYSAQIEVRKVVQDTQYDELVVNLPSMGDSDLLQVIVNKTMPEV